MGPVCLTLPFCGHFCPQAGMHTCVCGICPYANGLQHLCSHVLCGPGWAILTGGGLCKDANGMSGQSRQKARTKCPDHTRISEKLLKAGGPGHRGWERPRSIEIQTSPLLRDFRRPVPLSALDLGKGFSTLYLIMNPVGTFQPSCSLGTGAGSWLGREKKRRDMGSSWTAGQRKG